MFGVPLRVFLRGEAVLAGIDEYGRVELVAEGEVLVLVAHLLEFHVEYGWKLGEFLVVPDDLVQGELVDEYGGIDLPNPVACSDRLLNGLHYLLIVQQVDLTVGKFLDDQCLEVVQFDAVGDVEVLHLHLGEIQGFALYPHNLDGQLILQSLLRDSEVDQGVLREQGLQQFVGR